MKYYALLLMLLLVPASFVFAKAPGDENGIPPTNALLGINVGNQNVTAQSYNSYFNFVNGTGILILANYTTGTITWSATGSGGGENNTASNLNPGYGLFSSKVGADLQFKSLLAGNNVLLTSNATNITIDTISGSGGENNTASNLNPGYGLFSSKVGADLQFKSLLAGNGITLSSNSTNVTINSTTTISDVVTPFYYIVFNDAGTYKVIDGSDGSIDSSGADGDIAIQYALDNLPANGGIVHLKAGTYTIDTTLTLSNSNKILQGDGTGSRIVGDAGTVSPFIANVDTTARSQFVIRDIRIENTGSAGIGTAIDLSYLSLSGVTNVWIENFNRGIVLAQTDTFYNLLHNVRIIVGGANGKGIDIENGANKNAIMKTRIGANTASQVTGIYINSHGNVLSDVDVEGGTSDPLYGIDIGSLGHDTTITAPYLEGNDNNLRLALGVEGVTIHGGFIADANTNNVVDSGSVKTQYLGTRINFEPIFKITNNFPLEFVKLDNSTTGGSIKLDAADDMRYDVSTGNVHFFNINGAGEYSWSSSQANWLSNALVNALYYESDAADPADAGAFRMGNGELLAAESSPAGNDGSIGFNSGEEWEITVAPGEVYSFNSTHLDVGGNKLAGTMGCVNGQILSLGGGDWDCTTGGSGITSINGNSSAAQTIAGVSGNTTVTTSGATHTVNLGSNVVVTNGAAQNIAKAITVTNAATTNALKVDQNADSGSSTSVGGALLVENTGNDGAGIIIYSNDGATANGRLLNVRADNSAFDQSAINVDYDGVANAVTINNAGSGLSNIALSVTSSNRNDSTLGISGSQDARGTLKITHTKPATNDASAAAISVALDGAGTAAQGIFIDSTGNTTGKLMNVRTGGNEKFVVKGTGQTEFFAGAITMNGTHLDMNTAQFAGSMGCIDGQKLEYDAPTDDWICVTVSGGADNLGNHITTQDLTISATNKVIWDFFETFVPNGFFTSLWDLTFVMQATPGFTEDAYVVILPTSSGTGSTLTLATAGVNETDAQGLTLSAHEDNVYIKSQAFGTETNSPLQLQVGTDTNMILYENGTTNHDNESIINALINADQNTITNIENADIKASAAIDFSKLATLTSGNILVGSAGNVATSVNPSGDIDVDNTGAFSINSGVIVTADIGDDQVTYAKMQNVASDDVFLGRISGANGNTEELTGTQATSLLDTFTTSNKGLAPASSSTTNKFLRDDGTWAAVGGVAGSNSGLPTPPKKWGYFMPVGTAADGIGILQNCAISVTASFVYDTSDNSNAVVSTTATTDGVNGGIQCLGTDRNIFRGDQNSYQYSKWESSLTTNDRLFIGFNSGATLLPNNADTILDNLSGIGLCIRTTDTQYQYCRNDGDATTDYVTTGVNEDTGVHYVEVYTTDSGTTWCVKLDGATANCQTTEIPAATQRMYISSSGETDGGATSLVWTQYLWYAQNDK